MEQPGDRASERIASPGLTPTATEIVHKTQLGRLSKQRADSAKPSRPSLHLLSSRKPRTRLRRAKDRVIIPAALTTPSIGGFAPRMSGFHCWGCEDIRPGDWLE